MRSILLATALATAYALLRGWPETVHPLLRACLAVLALVLGIGLWRSRRKPTGRHATAIRPAHWTDYLAMGLGVLAVECLFLFFLTIAPPRAEDLALSLEETLRPEAAAARRATHPDHNDGTATNVSGNWLWDSLGRRRLPDRTNARPGNKPEVFLRTSDPTTLATLQQWRPYLTAFSLEVYEDATWSPEPISPRLLTATSSGQITFPQPPNRPGSLLAGEIFHPANPAGQDVLTTLQNPVSVTLPELRLVSPGILRLTPLPNPASGYDYPSTSRPLTFEQLIALPLTASFEPARNQAPSLLALPDNPALRDGLLQIAATTQGPLEVRLTSLRKFLQEHCKYSLEVTNPDDLDPIENFLFHERRGHCEFYATAAALLCRALNIPSRVSYGWTGGRYFPGQGLFMFRAREAHAWTEICLEEQGWVIFDCTPPGALDAATSSVAEDDEQPPIDEEGNYLSEDPEEAPTLGTWPWIALGAGLGLFPLVALLLRLRKRPRPGPSPDTPTLLPDPPSYLPRFKQACHRQGHPMPPGRTLRQQLQSLAQNNLSPTFANDLLDYHYATTYGTTDPDHAKEKHLTTSITNW